MIRFGIVGAGKIAQKFARDIRLVKDATLVGIASRDALKALAFKEKYDLDVAYGSYLEMAKDPNIDAVYIATPHNFHLEQSLLYIKHQKHVLCEKPIAVNDAQLSIMIAAAQENHVLLMEAMWSKFLPSTLEVERLIKERNLGKLLHSEFYFGYSLIGNYPLDGRLLNPELAGGSILDIGVYPISMLRNFTRQPIVNLNAKAEMHETGVDKTCVMDFTFADHSTAHLVSSIHKELSQEAKLVFENGTITMEDFSRSQVLIMNDEIHHVPYLGEGFVHEIQSFINTIEMGLIENEIMNYESTRDVVQIMDCVREKIDLKYPFE
ncbi:MAG: Gfo/Idh/MocA family oxidoreductase [Bacilli bacterium]|nr:Gfo/Idh/MocA family oxidoreductase [Bacilli bacterium]